jgi:hypothetical protein
VLSYAAANQRLAHDIADRLLRDRVRVSTDRQVAPGRSWLDETDRASHDNTTFVVRIIPRVAAKHGQALIRHERAAVQRGTTGVAANRHRQCASVQ